MSDLFDNMPVSYAQFRETAKHLTSVFVALVEQLESRGLVDSRDLERRTLGVQARVDQAWEVEQRKAYAEALRDDPGLGVLAKLMGQEIPLPEGE